MTVSMHSRNPESATLAQQVEQYLAQGGTIQQLPSSLTSADSELSRYDASMRIKSMRTLGRTWAVITREMKLTHAEAKQLWKEFD